MNSFNNKCANLKYSSSSINIKTKSMMIAQAEFNYIIKLVKVY